MNLAATLTLNAGAFLGGIASARAGLAGLTSGLASVVGITGGLTGVAAGVKRALDFGGQLTDLSANTGSSVAKLVVLRQTLADTGVGADSARQILNMMQRSLADMSGKAEGAKTLSGLKINLGDLKKLDPSDQFERIGKAIGGLKDPAERAAASMAIFGRSGGQLNAVFADPEAFETARKSLGALPGIMERNAKLFDQISDTLGRLRMKGVGLFAGLAEGIAPAMKQLSDAVDGLDLSGVGKKIGQGLAVVIEIFRSGKIGEALSASLSLGFKTAVNTLANGLVGAGVGLLALVTNPNVWASVGGMLLASVKKITAELLNLPILVGAGIEKLLQNIWEGLGETKLGKWLGLQGYRAQSFGEIMKEQRESSPYAGMVDRMRRGASNDFAAAAEFGRTGLASVADTMRNFEGIKIYSDEALAKDKQRLGAIVDEMQERIEERKTSLDEATAGSLAAVEKGTIRPATKGKAEEVDRLAKIGLFLGGGLGEERASLKAIERSSAEQVVWIKRLFDKDVGGNSVAAWARG